MSKFKAGDQVTVLPEIRESHPGRYDGQWEVQEMYAYNDATSVVVCRDGTRISLYEDCFERVQPSRMIFPYEELPEEERGEFAYQEVFADPPDYLAMLERSISDPLAFPGEPWFQSLYDGTMAKFGKVKIESNLVGCPVIMEFEDGRRSAGTITGVGEVKYEHGKLQSYELTVQESPGCAPTVIGRTHGQSSMPVDPKVSQWMQPLRFERKRLVHRASRGLRPPESAESRYWTFMGRVQEMLAGRMEKTW